MSVVRVIALAVVLTACGHPDPATTPPKSQPTAGDPTCPVLVPGTSVTVEDTPTGAALVFVTTGDAAEVRKRASALAAMAAAHDGPATAMGMMITTPAQAAASE